jgi:hypothetical protein
VKTRRQPVLAALLVAAILTPACMTAGRTSLPHAGAPGAPDPGSVPRLYRATARALLDIKRSEDERVTLAEELLDIEPEKRSRFLMAAVPIETMRRVRLVLVSGLDPVVVPATRETLRAVVENPKEDAEIKALAAAKLARVVLSDDPAPAGIADADSRIVASRLGDSIQVALGALFAKIVSGAPKRLFLPGPEFEHQPSSDVVRFVVIGDFGTADAGALDEQEWVAAAIKALHRSKPLHFGLTVGDNFYPVGRREDDGRFGRDFADLYGGLGVPFYPTVGNHDWYGSWSSVLAQIEHEHPSWRMPGAFYRFTAGPLRFLALDTDHLRIEEKRTQIAWLNSELSVPWDGWTIAYGHHPVLSGGVSHGSGKPKRFGLFKRREDREIRALRDRLLLPELVRPDAPAHLYIAGHEHDLQLLRVKGLHHMIVGTGGRAAHRTTKIGETKFCASSTYGFATVEGRKNELIIEYYKADRSSLDTTPLSPPPTSLYTCTLTRRPDNTVSDSCAQSCRP